MSDQYKKEGSGARGVNAPTVMYLSQSAVKASWRVLLVIALSGAASSHASSWNITQVLREAATNHPTVKTRQSESRAAGFELQGAEWGRYPSATLGWQGASGGGQAQAQVQQPLWTGGRLSAQIGFAQANLEASRAAVQEAQKAIMLEAANTFFETQRLEARLQAAQANEAEHRRLLEVIERRVRAEVSPLTDATQARARLQQAVSERLQFERQLESLRFSLEQIVGQPARQLIPPRDVKLDNWDAASLLEAAFRFSPERARLTAQIEAGTAQIQNARSTLMPQVSLGYNLKLGNLAANEDRGRLFLGVSMQTGAGLSSLAGIEVAVARQQAARDALEQSLRQLEQAVRSGWSETTALSSQLQPARALLDASNEVVESYLRQFQVGRKSWLDVLNAQREKTNARYALADIESPLLLARLRLLLLAGIVTPDSLTAIHD